MYLINLFGPLATPLLHRNEKQNSISPSGESEHFDLYNTTCSRIIIKRQNNQTQYLFNFEACTTRSLSAELVSIHTEGPDYHVYLIQMLLDTDYALNTFMINSFNTS